ncbi:MAG: dicarboxylate/amino acid:cation symporter [Xanthomonadales bacterium]|nr:dicarboxylate/amino acid:cation symporter [Gammaproteobacteria bacterium]MBT8051886.1 dicarboxylate/amino acid:cation symporter [Gammaproteobacteria bacterium]MBT8056376.1 dicarboxylate/amino acid:cation symporter [Gammaproteobacteria bacterium]NNL04814.1 dicarboxylate/amino acid:cation symporter [Xanthomonadales bacterium]
MKHDIQFAYEVCRMVAAGRTRTREIPLKLHTKIALGLVLGALAGGTANAFFAGEAWLVFLSDNVMFPVGQVFLRMLFMTVVPIVFTSIALGVAGIGDMRTLGRLGGRTFGYFALSTLIAATIGLTLVNTVKPGEGLPEETRNELMQRFSGGAEGMAASGPPDFGVSTFVNIVPRNPVAAAADMDMLALIFFALIFGAALTAIPEERAKPVIELLEGIGDAIIAIINWAMKLAPYGVFGLIFVITSQFGWSILAQLGMYVFVVLLGLFIHATIGVSGLVRFFGKMNPIKFWRSIGAPFITAFSTSSSMATLPTSIATAEDKLDVQPKIAGFVLPLGATMNMNGTSLFEGITVLFLAQVFGVDLSLGSQIIVVILAVLTAIGAAGVPGGSLPLMMLVMATVGVPPEGIAIILGVDRILDMSRTTLNVCGDISASVYVDRVDREMEGLPPAEPKV